MEDEVSHRVAMLEVAYIQQTMDVDNKDADDEDDADDDEAFIDHDEFNDDRDDDPGFVDDS